MANTEIECIYQATAVTLLVDDLITAMATPPVDLDFLYTWGLLLSTDETGEVSGQLVERGLVLVMVPGTDATATSTLDGNASTSVGSVTVTSSGSLYAAPPVINFSNIVNETGSASYPASAVPIMMIGAADYLIPNGGTGYTAPTAQLVGGALAPGGTSSSITGFTLGGGGTITAVTLSPGGPYTTPPKVLITDSTGSGAVVVLGMHVDSIKVTSGGKGYLEAPTVIITPLFKKLAPDTSNQASTVANFMTGLLQNATGGPVKALAPVVS